MYDFFPCNAIPHFQAESRATFVTKILYMYVCIMYIYIYICMYISMLFWFLFLPCNAIPPLQAESLATFVTKICAVIGGIYTLSIYMYIYIYIYMCIYIYMYMYMYIHILIIIPVFTGGVAGDVCDQDLRRDRRHLHRGGTAGFGHVPLVAEV